jgi:hypothetical protein
MKRYLKIFGSIFLSLLFTVSASAQPTDGGSPRKADFIGVIEKITVTEKLFGGKSSMNMVVVKVCGNKADVHVGKETVVMHHSGKPAKKKHLSDMQAIYAAFASGSATGGSVITPEVIVILDESVPHLIKYDVFDENGRSSDSAMTITLTPQTPVTDKSGNALSLNDAVNKSLLVFYDQAADLNKPVIPNKIIVIK